MLHEKWKSLGGRPCTDGMDAGFYPKSEAGKKFLHPYKGLQDRRQIERHEDGDDGENTEQFRHAHTADSAFILFKHPLGKLSGHLKTTTVVILPTPVVLCKKKIAWKIAPPQPLEKELEADKMLAAG